MTTTAQRAAQNQTGLMDHNRQDPYGLVGSVLDTTDARLAAKRADLDWTVETVTALADTAGAPKVVPDTYVTVRTEPGGKQTPLAAVGNKYHPLQNGTVFNLLQDIVDSSGAVFHTGGHTHGSKRTFVKMLLPDTATIPGTGGGGDPIQQSLVAFNSHDGSGKLIIVPTATRLFCTNQFPALKGSEVKFTAKHTTGALDVGLDVIRESLGVMLRSLDAVKEIGAVLADRPMSTDEFDAFLTALDPQSDRGLPENLQLKSAITRRDQTRALFLHAPNLDNVRGTQWAALQAVIEWQDWSAKGDNALRTVVRSPSAEAFKSRALELLLPGASSLSRSL